MNCIFLRRGYGETNKAPDYSDNFADNDWATIAAVCAYGLVPTTWKVGDQKAMTINGTNYNIDIIGIQHDEFSDGSGKAPFTFQFHEVYAGSTYAMNSSATNAGGWKDSAMRNTHLPVILAAMPSEVQAAIKEVNKLTSAGSQSSTIVTTADKLFLPSEWELQGKTSYSIEGEGTQYAYYAAGGVAARRKNMPGDTETTYPWRNRSPRKDNNTDFGYFSEYGYAYSSDARTAYRIAPAFCFGNKV